ncbi:MAG: hypothetical protein IKP73_18255 [Bacteroidales bacterium]|nr:hypothetical protein [Bacteroidales bacterium]
MESVFTITDQLLSGGCIRLEHTAHSYEGRRISVYTCGGGPVKVLAWSQMHGNEPTSTLALLDAMRMLQGDKELQSQITLTAIPMLNPDGTASHDRRNAQGIDVNRDAQSLISPEAKLLMGTWQRTQPKFALNLHDQETRYTSLTPPTPALLAMLAPECSADHAITPARKRAMQVIANVADILPIATRGRIARYDDVYTPTAFGDTLMRLGTSSILIEAGAASVHNDAQAPRQAMTKAIMEALRSMATDSYLNYDVQAYDRLPLNKEFDGYDLVLKHVAVTDTLGNYQIDIGIRRVKPTCNPEDFAEHLNEYRVLNIGDLGDATALRSVDLQGYQLNGSHEKLYIGCKIDFTVLAPDGKMIHIPSLLD